jgi:(p)ppGpp synthase/HD superfamily hydrolase
MDYNELYDKALRIAMRAHEGQRDKAGQDYVMHPIRVAERCDDQRAKVVALLHDTIEDSDVTADHLREEGFSEEIVEAVLAVTRREGEDYDDYVRRSAGNELGRMVKRADLEDNMDIRRLPELTDRDVERLRKYLRAWRLLMGS